MSIRGRLGAFLLAMGFAGGVSAMQGAVLSAGESTHEIGQAIFFQNAEQCYVLMPTHVVAEHGSNPDVVRYYRNNKYYAQTEIITDLGDDLSLLRARNLPFAACGITRGSMRHYIDSLLKNSIKMQLKGVDTTGAQVLQAVDLIDIGEMFLQVVPAQENMPFYKGQSGSMIFINQEPVGMILSINSRHGTAKVLRQDIILSKLAQYFRESGAVPAPGQQVNALIQDVQSTELSVMAQGAENLFLEEEDERIWSVPRVEARAASVKVAFQEQQEIKSVVFDVRTIDEALWPTEVSVNIDSSGKGQWHHLAYRKLDFQEGLVVIQFVPRLIKHIEFLFYPQQKNGAISLRRISIVD